MGHETDSRSPSDRWTLLAGVSLFVALLTAGVVLAAFTRWEPGAITGFLAGVAGLGVPLLAVLRATHAQNTTLAKIDEQTNGGLDKRIAAGVAAALRGHQTSTMHVMPPPPPPYTPPRKGR